MLSGVQLPNGDHTALLEDVNSERPHAVARQPISPPCCSRHSRWCGASLAWFVVLPIVVLGLAMLALSTATGLVGLLLGLIVSRSFGLIVEHLYMLPFVGTLHCTL